MYINAINVFGLYSTFDNFLDKIFKSRVQFKQHVATTLTMRGNISKNEIYVYDDEGKLTGYGGGRSDSPISNLYQSTFYFKGHWFSCARQANMWSKAKLFGDEQSAETILKISRLKEGEYISIRVLNYNDEVWEEKKGKILANILLEKFSQDLGLKAWLQRTGDAILAEIALEDPSGLKYQFDTEMGICLGISDDEIYKPHLWENYGNTLHGKSLMKVRSELFNIKM